MSADSRRFAPIFAEVVGMRRGWIDGGRVGSVIRDFYALINLKPLRGGHHGVGLRRQELRV